MSYITISSLSIFLVFVTFSAGSAIVQPSHTVDAKSSCGGKNCMNKGTLDINTCKCKCKKNHEGDLCEKYICPKHDQGYCGTTMLVQKADCQENVMVPPACPFMCGKCNNADQFDKPDCASRGGTLYGCDDCFPKHNQTKSPNYNKIKIRCPVMCGTCDPCGGKKCKNYGKLDIPKCECQCKMNIKGDLCEIFTCPAKDHKDCQTFWDESDCKGHAQARFECPFMCGLCSKGQAL